jgi:hypothetical protein
MTGFIIVAVATLVAAAIAVEIGVVLMKAMFKRNDPEAHVHSRRRARLWSYGITIVVLVAFASWVSAWHGWLIALLFVVLIPIVLVASFREAPKMES